MKNNANATVEAQKAQKCAKVDGETRSFSIHTRNPHERQISEKKSNHEAKYVRNTTALSGKPSTTRIEIEFGLDSSSSFDV